MTVKVYRNLNRHGVWYSVACASTGLVQAHATHILLANARFKVSQAGRDRVIKEKRKNVHAYVIGDLLLWDGVTFKDRSPINQYIDMQYVEPTIRVTYNPYKFNSFVLLDSLDPIHESKFCKLCQSGVYCA